MEKYHIIGLTREEISQGKELQLMDELEKIVFKNISSFLYEDNPLLVGSIGLGKINIKKSLVEKYGDYFTFVFVKDSLFKFFVDSSKKYRIIDVINESNIILNLDTIIRL